MKRLDHYEGLAVADQGAVIALGNFDGIHRGHQIVIGKAASIAAGLAAPLAVACFLRDHLPRLIRTQPTYY